jgi:hypothetical protein
MVSLAAELQSQDTIFSNQNSNESQNTLRRTLRGCWSHAGAERGNTRPGPKGATMLRETKRAMSPAEHAAVHASHFDRSGGRSRLGRVAKCFSGWIRARNLRARVSFI